MTKATTKNKATSKKTPKRKRGMKAGSTKTICVSLYSEDLARADRHVAAFKKRGYPDTGRSSIIRLALKELDVAAAALKLKTPAPKRAPKLRT